MTPQYIDAAAGCQKGVGSAETGIKVETVTTTGTDPEILTYDHRGTTDGKVHNFDPSVTITITGEIAGTTGLMTSKFGTAATIANEGDGKYADSSTTFWGIPNTGTFFPSGSPSVTSNRGELKQVALEFTMYPDLTD